MTGISISAKLISTSMYILISQDPPPVAHLLQNISQLIMYLRVDAGAGVAGAICHALLYCSSYSGLPIQA